MRWSDCVIGIISGFFAFTTTSRIIINNNKTLHLLYGEDEHYMKRENEKGNALT